VTTISRKIRNTPSREAIGRGDEEKVVIYRIRQTIKEDPEKREKRKRRKSKGQGMGGLTRKRRNGEGGRVGRKSIP